MLAVLRVRNLVLIDELELRLEPGCNGLTGETGAGKSIIVGALGLVLGARARPDLVRPGAAEAEVEALFDVSASDVVSDKLARAGLASDGELVIRRVVQATGRSRAYLNGRLCAARELSALARELADVTSQHESVALANPAHHGGYLDRFAKLTTRREKLARVVEELRRTMGEVAQLRERERSRAERESFVRYQLAAIDEVAPQPDELGELAAERNRLRHAEQLREITSRAARRLDRGDEALGDELGRLVSELTGAAELDEQLHPAASTVDDCWSRLREVARELERYAERVEADPQRLEQVQDRLLSLEGLLQAHGGRVEDVLDARQRLDEELTELGQLQSRMPQLERRRDELFELAAEHARKLSARRKKAARALSRAISAQLAELGMGTARVMVEVTPAATTNDELEVDGAQLGPAGIDRVEFLIAPNKGMQPRPLKRIASGGELSRSLLALKRALGGYAASAEQDGHGVGIQVFDEIDAGVGGATADAIGRAIAEIAQHRQVLCITHLAPIAAYADAHFVVSKDADTSALTTSRIRRLTQAQRAAELARMLTGTTAADSSGHAAGELLAEAKRWRSARSRAAAAG